MAKKVVDEELLAKRAELAELKRQAALAKAEAQKIKAETDLAKAEVKKAKAEKDAILTGIKKEKEEQKREIAKLQKKMWDDEPTVSVGWDPENWRMWVTLISLVVIVISFIGIWSA